MTQALRAYNRAVRVEYCEQGTEPHSDTKRALEVYERSVESRPLEEPRVRLLLGYLEQLTSLGRILVVGCGPRPEAVRVLRELGGTDAVGVEPVPRSRRQREHTSNKKPL